MLQAWDASGIVHVSSGLLAPAFGRAVPNAVIRWQTGRNALSACRESMQRRQRPRCLRKPQLVGSVSGGRFPFARRLNIKTGRAHGRVVDRHDAKALTCFIGEPVRTAGGDLNPPERAPRPAGRAGAAARPWRTRRPCAQSTQLSLLPAWTPMPHARRRAAGIRHPGDRWQPSSLPDGSPQGLRLNHDSGVDPGPAGAHT